MWSFCSCSSVDRNCWSWRINNLRNIRNRIFSNLWGRIFLKYLQKMFFLIKRTKASSSNVFTAVGMQVAVSATTDFECNIIFFRQQSGKIFLWYCLWSNCINRITKILLLGLKSSLPWSQSFFFKFCIVFIEIFLSAGVRRSTWFNPLAVHISMTFCFK